MSAVTQRMHSPLRDMAQQGHRGSPFAKRHCAHWRSRGGRKPSPSGNVRNRRCHRSSGGPKRCVTADMGSSASDLLARNLLVPLIPTFIPRYLHCFRCKKLIPRRIHDKSAGAAFAASWISIAQVVFLDTNKKVALGWRF